MKPSIPKLARPSEADCPAICRASRSPQAGTGIQPAPGKKYDDFQLSYALDLLHGKMTVASANASPSAPATQ